MIFVCNTIEDDAAPGLSNATSEYRRLRLQNESFIESGSAYFAQAFAEALALLAHLELKDRTSAGVNLQAMAFLLESALKEYEEAMQMGSATGINQDHEKNLRDAGLDLEGARRVLNEAQARGFWNTNSALTERIASTFYEKGYVGLMNQYLANVRDLHDLTVAGSSPKTERDAVAWQELGWKITTLFHQTLEFGKAIAILNTFTFRLPWEALASNGQ